MQTLELRQKLVNRRPALRIPGPAYTEKLPHSVIQPTLKGKRVLGTVRESILLQLLRNHLGEVFSVVVGHLVRE